MRVSMQAQALKKAARWLVLVAASLSAPLGAEVLDGRVVAVTDGDTIKVVTADLAEERVRLAGIDAPERAQPFGNVSKQHLSDLVYGKTVSVEWHKRDRWGRIVGVVLVEGVDAGLEQINNGLAWHYKKYEAEQPAQERNRYSEAENTARSNHIGIWSELDPLPPWSWRRR